MPPSRLIDHAVHGTARTVARSVAALACLALAAPVGAQVAVPRLAVEKVTLDNGLEVILHEDHGVPLVAVHVYYKVGSGDEKVGRTGFAHLFEHIMFMGSEHVPVGRFDTWLEAAGGNNNGTTNQDRTTYYETMPSNALPLALWLEADRMGYLLPTMDQAKLDLQREVVKNERRQNYDNQPYGRSYETLLAAAYPAGHPYSWPTIGSMADLSAAALDDVKGFFRTYYAPNNASLVIAGDFRRDSALALVRRLFGGIPRGPTMPARPSPAPVVLDADKYLVLEDRVQLPRVTWMWHSARALTADDAALDLVAMVLARGKGSRLYKRLVYETQLAQDVRASQGSQRLGSQFTIQLTMRPGSEPARVAAMVDEEVAKLVADGATPREFDRARNTLVAGMLDGLAGMLSRADAFNRYNQLTGTPDYVQQDAARFAALSPADIRKAARAYLTQRKVVLTVVPMGKADLMVKGGAQ
ncbi:MAG: insulinase family protein [Gemmatimonadetes bacterium]|nr:insulinase family protein [Gemmatimonadota bacterium]